MTDEERKDEVGRELARLLNIFADSKDDPEVDAVIAAAREVGWLPR